MLQGWVIVVVSFAYLGLLFAIACYADQRADTGRDRITQAIYKLFSNAVKFCEPGKGRVEVALAEDDGFLRVDVSDNGPSIRTR